MVSILFAIIESYAVIMWSFGNKLWALVVVLYRKADGVVEDTVLVPSSCSIRILSLGVSQSSHAIACCSTAHISPCGGAILSSSWLSEFI